MRAQVGSTACRHLFLSPRMEIPFSKSMLVALYLRVVNAEEAAGTDLRTRRQESMEMLSM